MAGKKGVNPFAAKGKPAPAGGKKANPFAAKGSKKGC